MASVKFSWLCHQAVMPWLVGCSAAKGQAEEILISYVRRQYLCTHVQSMVTSTHFNGTNPICTLMGVMYIRHHSKAEMKQTDVPSAAA